MTTRATVPANPDFTGVVVSRKWRVLHQIGKGNSTVWLCADQSPSTTLPPRAAKFVFNTGEVARRHELEHLSKMRASEHVVTLYDIDHVTHDGHDYLVLLLEYCDGGSLQPGISSADCATVAEHLLAGLERIHSGDPPLIHADIKPANVLRAGTDWKLADFDIAKPINAGSSSATNDGARTPDFMAPDQHDRGHRLTPADDIYSLGATIHYALTGALLQRQPGRDPDLSPRLPAEWAPFVTAACRLIPQDRATVGQLRRLIPHGAGALPAAQQSSTATTQLVHAERRTHRTRWIVAAAIAIAMSVLAGGIIAANRSSDGSATDTSANHTNVTEPVNATTSPAATSVPSSATTATTSPTTSTELTPPSSGTGGSPAQTLPTTPTTAAMNSLAQDGLTYSMAVRPLNCATYNALQALSGLPPISSWGNRTFSSSNWQELVAGKPTLQAWADAMSTFSTSSDTDFQTVSLASLRSEVRRLRDVVQRVVDAQSAEEANLVAVSDSGGETIMGILGDIDSAAYLIRMNLGLSTWPAPSYSTDCYDYWLV